MRSRKGQALLEFVLILPILLLFLLTIIDFGRIIYEKNRLESMTLDVVDLVNTGTIADNQIEAKLEKNYSIPLTLKIDRSSGDIIIKLSRSIDVLTPGLGIAISDPYIIEVSRVINNE